MRPVISLKLLLDLKAHHSELVFPCLSSPPGAPQFTAGLRSHALVFRTGSGPARQSCALLALVLKAGGLCPR